MNDFLLQSAGSGEAGRTGGSTLQRRHACVPRADAAHGSAATCLLRPEAACGVTYLPLLHAAPVHKEGDVGVVRLEPLAALADGPVA